VGGAIEPLFTSASQGGVVTTFVLNPGPLTVGLKCPPGVLVVCRAVNSLKCTHTHTRLTAPLSGTTRVSRYQKDETNLDFTEARDIEWQWHQLGRMQVCTSLQTDNHTGTPPLSFLQAGCPSCHPTSSASALKATTH